MITHCSIRKNLDSKVMQKFRKGNDLRIKWSIYAKTDSGEIPYSLTGKDLKITAHTSSREVPIPIMSVSQNVIDAVYYGKDQQHAGEYTLTLVENDGKEGMRTLDECDAFILTLCACSTSSGECDCDNLEVSPVVELTSAFEINMASGEGGGGGDLNVKIIRSGDFTTPSSDDSVYSSAATDERFLSTKKGGTVEGDVKVEGKVVTNRIETEGYKAGDALSGSGASLYMSGENSFLEVDHLKVRKSATFNEIIINQINFQRGMTVFSAAGCEITSVITFDTFYRCYYDNKGELRKSGFREGDLARCQRFDADFENKNSAELKYYWRKVVGVGDDYVDLSKDYADSGSGIPTEGDEIVQFGNTNDATRQSAIVISSLEGGSVILYSGIGADGFSMTDKNYVGLGINPHTLRAYMYGYGDVYFGNRDINAGQFITYQIKDGETEPQLYISGNVKLGAGSEGLSNLTEWKEFMQECKVFIFPSTDNSKPSNYKVGDLWFIQNSEVYKPYYDQGDILVATQASAIFNSNHWTKYLAVGKLLEDQKEYLKGLIDDLQKQVDGRVDSYFDDYIPSINNYPANEWQTEEEKQEHSGDTFTNINTGKSWRWAKVNNQWQWIEIEDAALAEIAKLKKALDGKCSVFNSTPKPPYGKGDLWIKKWTEDNFDQSIIYVCVNDREAGSFEESDWAIADNSRKYAEKILEEYKAQVDLTYSDIQSTLSAIDQMLKDPNFGNEAIKGSLEALQSDLEVAKEELEDKATKAMVDGIITDAEAAAITAAKDTAEALMAAIKKIAEEAKALAEAAEQDLKDLNSDTTVTPFEKQSLLREWREFTEADNANPVWAEIHHESENADEKWYRVEKGAKGYEIIEADGTKKKVNQEEWVGWMSSNIQNRNGETTNVVINAQFRSKPYQDIILEFANDGEGKKPEEGGGDYLIAGIYNTHIDNSGFLDSDDVENIDFQFNASNRGQKYTRTYKPEVVGGPFTIPLQYRKDSSHAEGTDAGYYRITNDSYWDGDYQYLVHRGSYPTLYRLLKERGLDGVADVLKEQMEDIHSLLETAGVWGTPEEATEATDVAEDFYDKLNAALMLYYAYVKVAEDKLNQKYTDDQFNDINYLKSVFPSALTDSNGAILAQLLAVKDSTEDDANIVAGLYGGGSKELNSNGFYHTDREGKKVHGTLMFFAGAEGIDKVASASTRIYEDGTIYTSKLFATDGKFSGTLEVSSGVIGGLSIANNQLSYIEGDSYRMQLGTHFLKVTDGDGASIRLGEESASSGQTVICRVISDRPSTSVVTRNVAMKISASSHTLHKVENTALEIDKGNIRMGDDEDSNIFLGSSAYDAYKAENIGARNVIYASDVYVLINGQYQSIKSIIPQ